MMPERFRDTAQCLCLTSRRAARSITRVFDQALRAHDLRATQFTLLSSLQLKGPLSVGELGAFLDSERTTITRNLAPLQRRGLIRTGPDRGDGRRRVVAITGKGARVLVAAFESWKSAQSQIATLIGPVAAEQFGRLPAMLDRQPTGPDPAGT